MEGGPSSESPLLDFLSEFRRGSSFYSSIKAIHSQLRELEESIVTTLADYHQNFRPVASHVTKNAAELRRLQILIDQVNGDFHKEVKPRLECVEVSTDDVSLRGTPSKVHAQAVEELEGLLKLHASCKHLLGLHNGLEALGDRINDLLRRCTLRNQENSSSVKGDVLIGADTDDDYGNDDLEFEEDNLNGWKSESPTSCGKIASEVSAILSAIKLVENLLTVDTFYDKSRVELFQAFMRSWLDRKRILRDFIDHYWSNMVHVYSESKEKSVIGRFEIIATTSELQTLVDLMNGLNETESRVQDVSKQVWELLFTPWLKFVTSNRPPNLPHLHFTVNESSGRDPRDFWSLELIEVDGKEVDGLTFILDTCRQLKSVLRDLSFKFFGLSAGNGRRLIDLCIPALKIFGMSFAKTLLEGCFLPNLPDALTLTSDSILESHEDDIAKFILATNGAISPLISTGEELGYFQKDAVDYLSDFLKNLGRLTTQRQDQAYIRALIDILEQDVNFASLEKVGGNQAGDRGKENVSDEVSEGQLEEAELAKLFRNVHLEFPVCYVSQAVILLLKQVDQIIRDAGGCKKDHLINVLRRVPHQIHLYAHCVPTLHPDRMKTDLKFVAVYHNDCMYLAHQCLILGRRRIYPLVELSGDGEETDLHTLASISTLHLVTPLRNCATSTLLECLRDRSSHLRELFNASRSLKDCAGEGREACEKAVMACISLMLSVSKSLDPLPVTVYLRALGAFFNEFLCLLCDAVLGLEDITTPECSTLLFFLDTTINSITAIFEKHLDAAFDPSLGGSLAKREEKNVTTLLERRIALWPRLMSLRAILGAASLEEVRRLILPQSTASAPLLRLPSDSVRQLVRAIFRPSTARSAFLRDLADSGSGVVPR